MTNTQTWATSSKTGGTLVEGASDTVEISLSDEALSLAVGNYGDTFSFSNTTSHNGDTTRPIGLTITPLVLPAMVSIPAGEFQMGDSFNEGYFNELPRHAVYIDAFSMDRYLVTNQEYAEALNWAAWQHNLITVTNGIVYQSGTSYRYCTTGTNGPIIWSGSVFTISSGKEDYPVSATWYGAAAYANWQSMRTDQPAAYDMSTWECSFGSGYRLPTEAE